MAEYGMGRVPTDVDPTDETVAEMAASERMAQLIEQGASALERYTLRNWQCCNQMDAETREPFDMGYETPEQQARPHTRCDRPPSLRILRSGTMGSGVDCEEHWLLYHRVVMRMPDATVEELLAAYTRQEEQETAEEHACRRCGKPGASWNSGAGQYLCSRDWDNS